jgi:hypothetical protein
MDALSNLTKIELWLFAICVRLYMKTRSITESGASRGQQAKVAKSPGQRIVSFPVSAVSSEFEKVVKISGKVALTIFVSNFEYTNSYTRMEFCTVIYLKLWQHCTV